MPIVAVLQNRAAAAPGSELIAIFARSPGPYPKGVY